MKFLAIVESNVSDPSWIEEYTEQVTKMVTKVGGRYLTRTGNVEMLEGEDKPQFSIVVEFPSREAALELYNLEEYQPFKKARLAGAECKFMLVPMENGTE